MIPTTMTTRVTNPLMIYTGGKFLLADWIISHFPKHRCYVEPFGGGGSVLLKKPRSKQEVYNDISDRVSNVFRVMRDQPEPLLRLLKLTPYARSELILATERSEDPVEDARRTIVRAHMSRGRGMTDHKGFRTSKQSNRSQEHTWADWTLKSDQFSKRLMGVLIENRDAMDLIKDYDFEDTLFYLDPPYPVSVRLDKRKNFYECEMTSDEDHEKLIELVLGLKSMVILSGYESPIYDDALKHWEKVSIQSKTMSTSEATEVLWISPSATVQGSLFNARG